MSPVFEPGKRMIRSGTLLCVAWVLTFTALAQDPVATCPGDVNLDGQQNSGDLGLLAQHLTDNLTLQGEGLANADVNFDKVVDVGDLTRLIQHSTREFLLLPCGDFAPVETECPQMIFGQPSAEPLERVDIGRLPADFVEPVVAIVSDADNELAILTAVELAEDGSASLFTPFYPGTSIAGGPVHVEVTDGMSICPITDFVIEAIPPAPGELTRLVDAIQELISRQAEAFDLTPEQLLGDPTELPSSVIPLAVAQTLVDDPNNLDSLRAMSEGTAPFFEGANDNTQLDAIVAHLQLTQIVEEDLGMDTAADQSVDLNQDATPSVATPQLLALFNCGESAESLDECMQTAIEADMALNPPDGPATSKLKEDAALTIAILEVFPVTRKIVAIPGEIIKELDKMFPVVSFALTIRRWAREAAASLLPSSLVSLDFNLLPQAVEEDLEKGEWGVSALIATSKGWKLDGKRVLANAFKDLGAKKILKKSTKKHVGKILETAGKFSSTELGKGLEDKLVDLIVDNVIKIAPDALEGVTIFEIDPELFGPVDIDDEMWSDAQVKGDTVELISHDEYKPLKVGSSEIIVRTEEGRFGGVHFLTASKTVQVKPIQIRILKDGFDVDRVPAKPGEEITFTVEVIDSAFPDQIKLEGAEGRASLELASSGNVHTLHYTAPPSNENLPEELTVSHTASTGACETNPGCGRSDTVEITPEPQVLVFPFGECVEPNESLTFSANVLGTDSDEVMWTASAGDVNPTQGSSTDFKAPPEAQTVTITATSVAFPDAQGEAIVKVGGCDCWWVVSIEGLTLSQPGDMALAGYEGSGFLGDIHLFGEGRDGLQDSVVFGPFQVSPGQTGDFEVHALGTLGVGPSATYGTLSEMPGTLSIIENDINEAVEGSFSGTVLLTDVASGMVEQRTTNFSARFRIGAQNSELGPNSCTVD